MKRQFGAAYALQADLQLDSAAAQFCVVHGTDAQHSYVGYDTRFVDSHGTQRTTGIVATRGQHASVLT